MTTRVMLYCVNPDTLSTDVIAEAARLPFVETRTDPDTGIRTIQMRVSRVHTLLVLVVGDELQSQLQGLTEHLTTHCELADPALPSRLAQVRGALEVAFEPEADATGKCERFLHELATTSHGFIYREDGSLEDADGQKVAWPRPAPPSSP